MAKVLNIVSEDPGKGSGEWIDVRSEGGAQYDDPTVIVAPKMIRQWVWLNGVDFVVEDDDIADAVVAYLKEQTFVNIRRNPEWITTQEFLEDGVTANPAYIGPMISVEGEYSITVDGTPVTFGSTEDTAGDGEEDN